MARYLVTGGAGFIGSHLAEELVRRGETVRVADNLVTGRRENLAHLPQVEFLEGDLADASFARRATTGVDYVLHQAAIPSVPWSIKYPLPSNRANVDATVAVLVAAREAGVRRVVFASTSAAYGDAPEQPKHEGMPTHALSPYALQKVIGEEYCQLFTELYGLETVVTRYFNVYGPRQDLSSRYSGVISIFIKALCEEAPVTIHGDGEQTRDFVYVGDVVSGVLRAVTTTGASGEVVNLATGGFVSLKVLFLTLCEITGAWVKPVYGEARRGDIRHSQADVAKARDLLGYRPQATLEEGLRRTVEWYRAAVPAS